MPFWALVSIALFNVHCLIIHTSAGLEINKILKSHLSTKWQKIVAKCKFLVAKSNKTQSIHIHEVINAQGFAMHYRACLLHRLFVFVSSRKSDWEGWERAKKSERKLVASDERERRVRWEGEKERKKSLETTWETSRHHLHNNCST